MRKRLAAVIGTAAVLLSLTACRSSPDVAVYVGDTEITEQRVTDLLENYNEKVPEDGRINRAIVVQYVVHAELCGRLSKEKGFTFSPEPMPETMPEFARIATGVDACINAIPAESTQPTDEEFRQLFDRAVAAGLLPADARFDEARQQWRGNTELITLLGRERALRDVAEVTVNPRYGQVPVIGLNPAVAQHLGAGSPVVVDRPQDTREH